MAEETPNDNPLVTHTGHPLTPKEEAFIEEYVISHNGKQSVEKAGYKGKPSTFSQVAYRLLNKDYIAEEINYRVTQISTKNDKIADATEVMEYFTGVMRGDIKDQFDLDAPLSERTRCAQELAKRLIDMQQRTGGNEPPKLTITVDWGEDASANVEMIDESVDTDSISDMFDTKKRDNLE